jgi:predicted PurR-regulated permease PerM
MALLSSAGVVAALLYVSAYFYGLVAMVGIALVLTYILLYPVTLADRLLERVFHHIRGRVPESLRRNVGRVRPRLISVLLVFLVFFTLATWAETKLAPPLVGQVVSFIQVLPNYTLQAQNVALEWGNRLLGPDTVRKIFADDLKRLQPSEPTGSGVVTEDPKGKPLAQQSVTVPSAAAPKGDISNEEREVIQASLLANAVRQVSNFLLSTLNSAVVNVVSVLTGTLTGLVYAIACILLVFYFLLDGQRLASGALQRLPKAARPSVRYLLQSLHQVMAAYVKGQVLLGLLTGAYMFVIYSILGIQYAIFLSAFFFLAELLPVVGTWIGITPSILVCLFSGNPWIVIPMWLSSYCYQTIKDNILAPKIVGDVMGLHPLVVILALVICGKVAGLLGVLLALPVASTLNVLIRFFLSDEPTLSAEDPVSKGVSMP